MPRLNELQSLHEKPPVAPSSVFEVAAEETLVPDRRLRQSTAQILEDKLLRLPRSSYSRTNKCDPADCPCK